MNKPQPQTQSQTPGDREPGQASCQEDGWAADPWGQGTLCAEEQSQILQASVTETFKQAAFHVSAA